MASWLRICIAKLVEWFFDAKKQMLEEI